MAYSKQTWVRGEKVASTKLNHMEDGIAAISANGAIGTANLENGAVTAAKLDESVTDIVADTFSTSSAYSVGDYVIYSGALYRFTADKAAGAWDASKVVAVALADDVTKNSEFIDDISETKYGKNRFNINGSFTIGYYLGTNGELIQSATWNVSDYCFVKGFSNVFCWNNANGNAFTMWYVCAYKEDKTFLSYLGYGSSIAIPENAAYIRFCEQQFADGLMLESGTSKTTFEPYTETKTLLTDESLSEANLPANAKATGEAIYDATANLKSVLSFSPVALTMIGGKFLNATTGAITDTSGDNNKVSDYIEIEPNSAVMLTTEHFWSQGLYAFYDADRNYITGRAANSGGTVTQLHNEIISTPSNAKYIVIGYLYQASMPQSYLFVGVKSNAIKRWSGLKWSCIGDSLTAYNERTSMHYFDYIAAATGISIYNMGVSGSGYAKLSDNFRTRVLNTPTDSDVVTIFGSGNDASAGLDLGTASDTGTTTLGGVINTTLDNLYSIMPVCNVGIITPTPWQGNMPFDGGWMENYANLIVAICKRRSIPCLDLYHCSGLNPNSAEVRAAAYSKDDGGGVHPDEVGHKMIATKVQAFLDTLLLH